MTDSSFKGRLAVASALVVAAGIVATAIIANSEESARSAALLTGSLVVLAVGVGGILLRLAMGWWEQESRQQTAAVISWLKDDEVAE